jgi:hypothetical protein
MEEFQALRCTSIDLRFRAGGTVSMYCVEKETLRSYVAKEDSEVHVMFENSLLESGNRQKKRNVCTTLASFALQSLVVGLMFLVPPTAAVGGGVVGGVNGGMPSGVLGSVNFPLGRADQRADRSSLGTTLSS